MMTAEEIEAGRSEKGGYTKAKLEEWGVPWPPPKGWKKALIAGRPVKQHQISCMLSLTLTDERMQKLWAAADETTIKPNHYALIMLNKMIDRGEFLTPEDWWQGTKEDLAYFKAVFCSDPPRA